jgi:hypothetical protein
VWMCIKKNTVQHGAPYMATSTHVDSQCEIKQRRCILKQCQDYMLTVAAEEDDWLPVACLEMSLLMAWQASFCCMTLPTVVFSAEMQHATCAGCHAFSAGHVCFLSGEHQKCA